MTANSKGFRILTTLFLLALALTTATGGAGAQGKEKRGLEPYGIPLEGETTLATPSKQAKKKVPPVSGIWQFRGSNTRTQATQNATCPDGLVPKSEQQSARDDIRADQDDTCQPQNETSMAVNPRNTNNIVGGANDYRLGFGTSGYYSSFDRGQTWVDGILPFPSLPNGDNLDGGGDPALTFDREGTVYYANINFNRTDDSNGVFVNRSGDGGRTWSRPCVPFDNSGNPGDNRAVCGGPGDPRQPGDGVVTFVFDDNTVADGSQTFNDKEYIASGPRPAGVTPQCFGSETRTVVPCRAGTVGPDRLYVTWSAFQATAVNIYLSYSDDRGRSWSRPKSISGAVPFCLGGRCNFNQFSVPTVNPVTGQVFVSYENFNTVDENQILVVRSTNGGQTFVRPMRAATIHDTNYPVAGNDPAFGENRPDCTNRGQQPGRAVLTNSCFRIIGAGTMVVDKRGGEFANDLYLVFADNRNGTKQSSNSDIFLYKSTDAGMTWVGPTRVNNDVSRTPANRDCVPGTAGCGARYGYDQIFPWVDIDTSGRLTVAFHDRRLDTNSTAHEYGAGSRSISGNYLMWYWGAQCTVTTANSRQCTAPTAQVTSGSPPAPINPGSGPQPGSNQTVFPLNNVTISDVPSNMDYSFRGGIFMGDYNSVVVAGGRAHAFWTDARRGRSSRLQPGRNPLCEQSDVYHDDEPASGAGSDTGARSYDSRFLRAQCE
jgi:hypothetical protein